MMKTNNLDRDKIDILKAIAIIAVILIHTISYFFGSFTSQTKSWIVLFSFDQFIRFSVPLFISISGFTLAYKYRETYFIPLKDFYLRRVVRILPLYLIFSVFIYFFIYTFDAQNKSAENYSLVEALIFGRADYHLYFVPMIFQLYLLFPLLFYFVSRYKLKVLVPIFIFQIYAYFMIGTHVEKLISDFGWSDQSTYIYFWNWLFYFCLGIYLSRIVIEKSYLKYFLFAIAILSFDWLVENSIYQYLSGVNIVNVTRFTQIPTLFYATSVIILTIIWGNRLSTFPKLLKRILTQMGKDSFVVFLIHTVIIRMLFSVWNTWLSENIIIFSLSVIVISFIFARLFNFLLQKSRISFLT